MTKIYLIMTTDDTDYDGATVYLNKDEAQAMVDKMNKRRIEAKVDQRAYVQELTVKA